MMALNLLEYGMGSLSSVRLEANSELLSSKYSEPGGRHSLKRVLTYGTFDLLHYGHVRLLQQALKLGDYLIVGLSTDNFIRLRVRKTFIHMMSGVRCLRRCGTLIW